MKNKIQSRRKDANLEKKLNLRYEDAHPSVNEAKIVSDRLAGFDLLYSQRARIFLMITGNPEPVN